MWQIYDYYMLLYGIICDKSNVYLLIITYNNISKPQKKHCQQNHDFDPLAGIPGSRAVAGGPILPSLVPVLTARTPVGDRHGIYQQSDINEDKSGAYQFTFAKYGLVIVYISKISWWLWQWIQYGWIFVGVCVCMVSCGLSAVIVGYCIMICFYGSLGNLTEWLPIVTVIQSTSLFASVN